jgi:hypothetical protein
MFHLRIGHLFIGRAFIGVNATGVSECEAVAGIESEYLDLIRSTLRQLTYEIRRRDGFP